MESALSLEKEKDNFCVVLAYFVKRVREIGNYHVAVVQRRLRNGTKMRDELAQLLFCWYESVAFLPVLFAVAGVVAKLPIVVTQKFCCHGNVTSHFSSLLHAC